MFESVRSLVQDLTFETAEEEFENRNIPFSEDKYIALGMRDAEKDLFTNLAFLLSDQCSYSIKAAIFDDPSNTKFIDRHEFTGFVFKQLYSVYDYLMFNNRTVSEINGLDRTDNIDYPPEAIRETLLNAIVHRDYSYSGSIIININKSHMEFVFIGGLLQGLTKNDIMSGISQPRNEKLAQIFFRLKHIEAYGTGIRRIYDLNNDSQVKPEITVSDNTFRIALPNMNFNHKREFKTQDKSGNDSDIKSTIITAQMQEIINYLEQYETITDEEIMDLLNLKRTRTYIIARQMFDLGLIEIKGRGVEKKYSLPK